MASSQSMQLEMPRPGMSAIALDPDPDLEGLSLVLSAVGIDHWLSSTGQQILVREQDAVQARHHIEQYVHENQDWPPTAEHHLATEQWAHPPTLVLIGLLALLHWWTGPWQDNSIWFHLGAVDSRAIFGQNQWWRAITALTLHADGGHLVANCIIGGFMTHLLCRTTGYGLAWFLLILCGACGNLVNIALRPAGHLSVGFSTAIFAAIGIFSGLRLRYGRNGWLTDLIIPLGAGIGLLAFLGTEGDRTDLGAHLFGFCCGLMAGGAVRILDLHHGVQQRQLQGLLFCLAMGGIFLAWLAAFRSSAFYLP